MEAFILPDEKSNPAWWSYFPLPYATICHNTRITQLVALTHKESKAALMEECSVHILIDCLFLTVTMAPIFNLSLPVDGLCVTEYSICAVVAALFYATFAIQTVSILLQCQLLFAYMEVPTGAFPIWVLSRREAILFANRVHILGVYVFLTAFSTYPIALYEDRFMAYLCTATCVLIVGATNLLTGTTLNHGYFDCLGPHIRLQAFPRDRQLRALAEADEQLFFPTGTKEEEGKTHKPHLNMSMKDFLDNLGMGFLEPKFASEGVSLMQIQSMQAADFRSMGIKIGDRIKIEDAFDEMFGQDSTNIEGDS